MTYLVHILAALGIFLCGWRFGVRRERDRWRRPVNDIAVARSVRRWKGERAKANPGLRVVR